MRSSKLSRSTYEAILTPLHLDPGCSKLCLKCLDMSVRWIKDLLNRSRMDHHHGEWLFLAPPRRAMSRAALYSQPLFSSYTNSHGR
jgi:hypothetical protein